MKKKIMAVIAIFIVICMILVYGVSFVGVFNASAAPSKSQYQTELNQVKQEKREILQKAQDKQVEISDLQKEINAVQFDISAYEAKIAKTQEELNAAEQREKEQYAAMKLRLRTLYEDNNTTYINLLFSGESLTEVLSYIEIIKQMSEHDNGMHEALAETRKGIEETKTRLEEEKSVLDQKRESLQISQNKLYAEKAELDSMAAELNAEESELLAAIRKIEEEEQALQRAIISGSSHSSSSVYKGGRLGYPTSVTVTNSPYGYRIHPIYGTRKLHSGMDFAVASGSPIYAAADGTVIMASWYGGYGNCVIIDHGGGMTTLYAHNTSLTVSNGQRVKRGDVIARAGSTGNSTGPHCHFEVRINGSTTDPAPYF